MNIFYRALNNLDIAYTSAHPYPGPLHIPAFGRDELLTIVHGPLASHMPFSLPWHIHLLSSNLVDSD